MSCKALIGEGTARKSGAKQRHGKELFRRGKAERNAVCWGMASNCLVLVLSTKKKGESMKEHRRQEQVNGKWVTVGMQYYPDCVDWQK